MKINLAHIINPYLSEKSPSDRRIQEITFESMRIAREEARGVADVQLLTAQFAEDHPIIPGYFNKTPDLQRSVQNFGNFKSKKKLPLIGDIIQRLYDNTDADYLIYTNVDIILRNDFYRRVSEFINRGFDAFIINRRRIEDKYNSVAELPEIWKEKGKSHPGFDCFVIHRSIYPKMFFGNICVGMPFIEATFAHNLFCYANNFRLFDKEYLTYHLGMEIMPPRDKELYWYNRREFFNKVKWQLWPHFNIWKFPYAHLPFPFRYIRWGLNPSLFTFMNFKLELRYWRRWMRRKMRIFE